MQLRTVALQWTPPPGAVSHYVLEAGTHPGGTNLAVLTVAGTSLVSPPLPFGRYFVRVRAISPVGAGPASNEVEFDIVPALAPGPPTGLAAVVTGRTVTLSWQGPQAAGALRYTIEAGSAPGMANIGVALIGSNTTVAVPNVPPGVYYVRVRAQGDGGAGPPSNEVDVRVP